MDSQKKRGLVGEVERNLRPLRNYKLKSARINVFNSQKIDQFLSLNCQISIHMVQVGSQ
jgi:hypothetical protein